MKTKSLIVGGLLAFTSCANQAEPFYISNLFPLSTNCGTDKFNGNAPNGYLDVAAGAPQFFIGAQVVGGKGLKQAEVKVGAAVLETENRNRPIITQVVVTYRLSKRVGATPKPYITNLTLPFNGVDTVTAVIQLISPDLGTQLFDGLTPSPGVAPSSVIEDFVDISADVEFKGELSGTRTPFATGTLTYPLRAYRSNPTGCSAGFQPFTSAGAAADGGVAYVTDPCQYVGQSITQNHKPAPPSACCPGPGC